MIMTEFPIIDNIMTNKKYKNLNKSNSFKEKQRSFKRQEKRAKQIAELPIKFQKAIQAIVSTTQEKKPKPYLKPKNSSQKKMSVSARSVQNILDEEYEGKLDAYDMLQEEHWLDYQEFLLQEEEKFEIEKYEQLAKEAEKDYCELLFDLREDFPTDFPEDLFNVCGGWSSDEEDYQFYSIV
jgi:hypothetical protein